MSPAENTGDRLKALPHMTEEHFNVLNKHGITTPEKLLETLKDASKWKVVHAELKGIGPKTVEKWRATLEPGYVSPAAAKPAPAEKAKEAPKPQPQVVKIARQVKKPTEVKKEPAPPKSEPEKGAEEKPEPEKPKVKEKAEVKKVEPEKPKAEPEKKKPSPEKAKAKEKSKEKTKEKAEEKEEEVEVVEEGEYIPSKKPKLSPEIVDSLKKRDKISETRPEFTRQEYGRRLRLRATGWRKPRGIHSKTRYKMRYRRPMVSIGYAGPKLTKNYHPSGFREVQVFNVADLAKISDADQQAARISHGVGRRKRELIIKKADELGIRVLNRR